MTSGRRFDFVELPKENSAEKQNGALPRFDNPQNDNERLLNCQYEYLHGERRALDELYCLSLEVCVKYIQCEAKKNRHVRALSFDEVKEKAHNAAVYLISQYLTRSDFCVKKSVTAYLFLRVKHELFYRRKVDALVEYTADI